MKFTVRLQHKILGEADEVGRARPVFDTDLEVERCVGILKKLSCDLGRQIGILWVPPLEDRGGSSPHDPVGKISTASERMFELVLQNLSLCGVDFVEHP